MIRIDAQKARERMTRSSEFIKMSRAKDQILDIIAERIENLANKGRSTLEIDERNETGIMSLLFSVAGCDNEGYDYNWIRDSIHTELEDAGFAVYFTFGGLQIAWR